MDKEAVGRPKRRIGTADGVEAMGADMLLLCVVVGVLGEIERKRETEREREKV